jgi:hypothetical protein
MGRSSLNLVVVELIVDEMMNLLFVLNHGGLYFVLFLIIV